MTITRIVNITSIGLILITFVLFVIALNYLGLQELLLNPVGLLECDESDWHDLFSGKLRSTGVGRYAALTSIIALVNIANKKFRSISIAVLIVGLILLVSSGARGAMVGFGVGVTVCLLCHLSLYV